MQVDALLLQLATRFHDRMDRHLGVDWTEIRSRLEAQPAKLESIREMERTGGEPDVILIDDQPVFVDCVPESPSGRRSLCYDEEARLGRKQARPDGSAVGMAQTMGVELLDETAYRALQAIGPVDLKTSSWIATPPEIRRLGGSLFCDRRYDRVFTFHNGAESYYASRGFRALLRL